MNSRNTIRSATGIAFILIAACSTSAQAAGEIPLKYLFVNYGFSSAQRYSRPSGVFFDSRRSELYVADSGNGQIVVLDRKGIPVARIPHSVVDPVSGNRRKGEPRSMVVQKNGDFLVVDNQCTYLDVMDFQGHSVRKVWPAELLGLPKQTLQPRCVAQDVTGNVYLGVSGGEKEIMVLTPDLKLKTTIGVETKAPWVADAKGESSGESRGLTGIWADNDGTVYATYGKGTCVRLYAPDGKQLLDFGSHDAGPQNFSLPSGLVTDEQGRIWVVDTLRHVVSVFNVSKTGQNRTSKFLSLAIGGMGQAAGDLAFPSAIASDGARKIFVLESTGSRVQGFEIQAAPVSAPAN